MLNVTMLNAIMLNVNMLNVIMLNVITLNVIMLSVIKQNVIMLSVIRLNNAMLKVVAPFMNILIRLLFLRKFKIWWLFLFTHLLNRGSHSCVLTLTFNLGFGKKSCIKNNVCFLVCLFVYLFVCWFVCLFVCLFACLFVCLLACSFVCMFSKESQTVGPISIEFGMGAFLEGEKVLS